MLDIKFIRKYPDLVKRSCQAKGAKVDIDLILKIDKERIETLRALEKILSQKNQFTKEIAIAKDREKKQKTILKMQELDKKSDRLNKKLKELEAEFKSLIVQVPNLPLDDVPFGKDERDNVVLKKFGEIPKFDFQPKNYLEISEKLDIIDMKRAAKTSGSRFGLLKNEAVLIEFALINFVFDTLTKKGFIPLIPPVMLKEEMARGTGYFEATDRKEAYFIPEDKLFLVGTAEQSIIAIHNDEILNEKELPKRYLGFSTCFRREAGSYGKESWGIFRVHQFDKIEMISFSKPEDSKKEHQFFLKIEEKLMQSLKIPYRVVKICTGDLGFPAAAKYDIEAWMPSRNEYRETHSTSNCTDFQARRLNIRYRTKSGKLNFVHIINGTAFAIGRILIAIIENYQQKDGSILLPKVLQKYLNFKVIPKK